MMHGSAWVDADYADYADHADPVMHGIMQTMHPCVFSQIRYDQDFLPRPLARRPLLRWLGVTDPVN